MGTWQVPADLLARSRFTVSPLQETVAALMVLDPSGNRPVEPWQRAFRVAHQEAFASMLAAHPVLEGRHQRRVLPGHRKGTVGVGPRAKDRVAPIARTGEVVAQRPLEFYDAVARRLAREGRA